MVGLPSKVSLFVIMSKFNDHSSYCIATKGCIITICYHTSNSIPWEFLKTYEVILVKYSISCIFVVSLSYIFVVVIYCKVGLILFSFFLSNPNGFVNIWELLRLAKDH